MTQAHPTAAAPENSARARALSHYILRLYVVGTTPRCLRAIANIRAICEEHLPGRHDLEILDIVLRPELAAREQIVAAPTLIRSSPLPARRFIGDLSDRKRIIAILELPFLPGGAGYGSGD